MSQAQAGVSERTARIRDLESLLFVSDEPVTSTVLAQALDVERREADELCKELAKRYDERGAGIVLRNVAGGWRLTTHPEASPVVEQYVLASRHARLTKAALETLSIVAYKQPVTRHQISAIRGVDSDGVLRALIERGLVDEVGREDAPGRPMLYGTTPEFLERLGLSSLSSLPSLAPLLDADAVAADGPDDADASIEDRASDDAGHGEGRAADAGGD
jgi:segregation and condensation protein B